MVRDIYRPKSAVIFLFCGQHVSVPEQVYVRVCVRACMCKLFCVHAFAMILQGFCSLSLICFVIYFQYIQINPLWEIHVALKLSTCTGISTAATRAELPDPTSVHNA